MSLNKILVQRHRVNAGLDYSAAHLRPALLQALMDIVFLPFLKMAPEATEEVAKAAFDKGHAGLEKFTTYLGDSQFVGGQAQLSIADIQLFFEVGLWQLCFKDQDVAAKHPKIWEWFERCKENEVLNKVYNEMDKLCTEFAESLKA